MIGVPADAFLEQHYSPGEIDVLRKVRSVTDRIQDKSEKCVQGRKLLRALWPEELLYISKTHFIRTKEGEIALLKPNYAQKRLYDAMMKQREQGLPERAIILKARQLGFSTFIQSLHYETCDAHPLQQTLTVSYDNESTRDLLRKAEMIHSMMWFPRPTNKRAANEIAFEDNQSRFKTKTQGGYAVGRGETYQRVHCSEVPMWTNDEEALLGMFQAVPSKPLTGIVIESTARGAAGSFYEQWVRAENGESDFVPFFAPWFWDPEYRLDFTSTDRRNEFVRKMLKEDREYMAKHSLTLEQMHWREWKARNELGSKRKFRQEFPAEPMEAFLTTGSPAFDPDKVHRLYDGCLDPWANYELMLSGVVDSYGTHHDPVEGR